MFFITTAQFPISLSIKSNLQTMLNIIAQVGENELVVFPEGALSGYDPDPNFLEQIDLGALEWALGELQTAVSQKKIHLIFGSCLFEHRKWVNAGLYFSHNATPFIYHKINLATNERAHFQAGATLSTFTLNVGKLHVTAGMQLCREIRFPEQWQHLARAGAQILFYLTNAVGDDAVLPVWRSHLISRAAENQRFVIAANNAHIQQKCPTMIINPAGNVLAEVVSDKIATQRTQIQLNQVSNWYLDQARMDVVGQSVDVKKSNC